MTVLAVVIATRNRRESLLRVLDRLGSQSLQPSIIVVSDSSDDQDGHTPFPSTVGEGPPVHHLRASVASSARQRNEAIACALELGADTIQILDDDTIPESSGFLAHQLEILTSASEIVGVSGVTIPRPDSEPKRMFTKVVFRWVGLHSTRSGCVTRAGVGIPIPLDSSGLIETEWVFACSMWKRRVFDTNWFRADLPGTALGEDVEFSVRAARLGTLVICPHCVLLDENAQTGRLTGYLYWYRQVRNRWFIVQAQPRSFGALVYTMSNLTLMTMHLVGFVVAGTAAQRRSRLDALRGCYDGFRATIMGSPPK
jgi:GT2 family glycosyltransferase